jgi:hypothetical protein
VCGFYLWSNLKQKVYRNRSHTLDSQQIEIWNVILEIMDDELHLLHTRDVPEVMSKPAITLLIMRKGQKVPGIQLYRDYCFLLKQEGWNAQEWTVCCLWSKLQQPETPPVCHHQLWRNSWIAPWQYTLSCPPRSAPLFGGEPVQTLPSCHILQILLHVTSGSSWDSRWGSEVIVLHL